MVELAQLFFELWWPQTDRHTHTHTHTQTDRQTDRQTDTHTDDMPKIPFLDSVALKT